MFQNGELTSARRSEFWPGAIESWLHYQQPLRDGDKLHYEFFHQAGKFEAAPTIGRIAYLFGSEGITRHWLTDGKYDVFNVAPDNGILEKKKLTLKEDDWNVVEMSLSGDQLKISLNGKPAVTEKLKDSDSRFFGFYHDAGRTSLRVRNAKLTGNWPKEFTAKSREDFEWPQPKDLLPETRLSDSVISEEQISDNAYEIERRSLKLDAKSRYNFLHRWVMPNSTHDLIRMAGAFTPTHPATLSSSDHPIDLASAKVRQTVDQNRVQAGGNFVCPAISLVSLAAETGQLEKLKQEVVGLDPASAPEMARCRSALMGIISLVDNQPEAAVAAIWDCHKLVTDQEGGLSARWGDVALATLALRHPLTREATYYLLDRIQSQQLQVGKSGSAEFSHFVRQLHGEVHYLMYGGALDQFGVQPKTKQWRAVSHATARSRGSGWPVASFDTVGGELALRGGHEVDVAYFQSPLQGNYEVSGRLSLSDFREMQMQVAGLATSLKSTNNHGDGSQYSSRVAGRRLLRQSHRDISRGATTRSS